MFTRRRGLLRSVGDVAASIDLSLAGLKLLPASPPQASGCQNKLPVHCGLRYPAGGYV